MPFCTALGNTVAYDISVGVNLIKNTRSSANCSRCITVCPLILVWLLFVKKSIWREISICLALGFLG
jgi:hypothetical protein